MTKYHNHTRRRQRFQAGLLGGLGKFLMVALTLAGLGMILSGGEHGGGAAMASLGFLGGIRILRDANPDDNGGGGAAVMSDEEFQRSVLKAQKKNKETVDDLVAKYDNLDKETKKAFEELTKLKNADAANHGELTKAIQKLNLQLANELRQANGDPVKRIMADEEKRTYFNAAVRAAAKVGLTAEMRTTLGEDSSPGSTYINDALADDIYDTLAEYGVFSSFDVRRVGTKTTKYPVKTARASAAFVLAEGGAIPEDAAKAGNSVSADIEVIGSLLPVSKQLLEDSEYDVTADVMRDFAESGAERLDYACLRGDGTADGTNGGFTGIFEGGTAAVAAAGNLTVETTDFEDWTKVLLTVDPIVLARKACWWMHPQILIRALSVKDGNGRPIFLTATEAPAAGGIGTILGYPVKPAYVAPTANAANAKVAVFGDPSGMVVPMRKDFEFEASDHAGFTTYERYFRGIMRAAAKIRRAQAFGVLTLPAA